MTPDELDKLADATAKRIAESHYDGEQYSPHIIRAALAEAVAAERARCVAVLQRRRGEHETASNAASRCYEVESNQGAADAMEAAIDELKGESDES